jgi:hypothetical protein
MRWGGRLGKVSKIKREAWFLKEEYTPNNVLEG